MQNIEPLGKHSVRDERRKGLQEPFTRRTLRSAISMTAAGIHSRLLYSPGHNGNPSNPARENGAESPVLGIRWRLRNNRPAILQFVGVHLSDTCVVSPRLNGTCSSRFCACVPVKSLEGSPLGGPRRMETQMLRSNASAHSFVGGQEPEVQRGKGLRLQFRLPRFHSIRNCDGVESLRPISARLL